MTNKPQIILSEVRYKKLLKIESDLQGEVKRIREKMNQEYSHLSVFAKEQSNLILRLQKEIKENEREGRAYLEKQIELEREKGYNRGLRHGMLIIGGCCIILLMTYLFTS